jgi:hypothetical protein
MARRCVDELGVTVSTASTCGRAASVDGVDDLGVVDAWIPRCR